MSKDRIPYFDFYPSDFMHGVRGLSAQEVGVYTMMLCRIYEENGPVEYHVMRLATYCGMRESTFVKTVEKLIELGKLDLVNGMISNHRAEAEISSRAHKLKINSKAGKASAEKRQQKQRMTSTDVQQTFNHTDTDTDTDNTSSLRSDVTAQAPAKAKRGSRLPDDFMADISEAVRLGLSEQDAHREADKFRDYWASQPGQRGVKLDWPATWRNWCRSAVERKQPRRNETPPKPRNIGDAIRDEARRLGVLRNEPDSENRGFHSEGQPAGNVRVLDLAFKPALKGFG